MAQHVEDIVLDQALTYLGTNAGRVDLCETEPTNYTQATSTFTKANAVGGGGFTAPYFAAPGARAPNGRQVASAAISGAPVTGTTSTGVVWMAISKTTATAALLIVMSITSQQLTSGNTWNQASTVFGLAGQ